MLTVEQPGRRARARARRRGRATRARPIRWVHISELEDPTPWLSGGELLLTTGIQLDTAARQRRFVEPARRPRPRRARARHRLRPRAAPEGAGRRGREARLPALRGALRDAVHRDHRARLHPARQRAVRGARARDGAARAPRAAGARGTRPRRDPRRGRPAPSAGAALRRSTVAGEVVAEAATGAAARRGERGRRRSAPSSPRADVAGPIEAIRPDDAELGERALAVPVPARGQGVPRAWLVGRARVRPAGRLRAPRRAPGGDRRRARADAREDRSARPSAGSPATCSPRRSSGRLAPDELREPPAPRSGSSARRRCSSSTSTTPRRRGGARGGARRGRRPGARRHDRSLGARAALRAGRSPAAAIRSSSRGGPARRSSATATAVRAAASRAAPVASRAAQLPRGALRARGDLARRTATRRTSRRTDDLGAFTLLLALQDDEALRAYSDNLLAPIERTDGEYGDELLRSLEAYIEQNGQWERAARELYCHRHTLRYRIRRIEELTGRDLSRAHDRIELWLALRARELVEVKAAVLGAGGTIGARDRRATSPRSDEVARAAAARPRREPRRGGRRGASDCAPRSAAAARRRGRRGGARGRDRRAATRSSTPRATGSTSTVDGGVPSRRAPLPRPRRPLLDHRGAVRSVRASGRRGPLRRRRALGAAGDRLRARARRT